MRRALAVTEAAVGASHPETAKAMVHLALALDYQGKYAEAVELLKGAFNISVSMPLEARTHPGLFSSVHGQ